MNKFISFASIAGALLIAQSAFAAPEASRDTEAAPVAVEQSTTETTEKTHKHYKATMPGESHKAYTDSQKTEKQTTEKTDTKKSHEHYKASMPGETHQKYVEDQKKNAGKEKAPAAGEKTHKHYKATMPGESHQDYVEDQKQKKYAE